MKVVGLVGLFCLAAMTACGGAEPAAAPYPDTAADAEEAPAEPMPPGYGQPGQPAPKGVTAPPSTAGGLGSDAPPLLLPDRQLDTLDDALTALSDDQKLLDLALMEPIPTAELGVSACRRVCSAIGSMRRSADAICRLAGEDDSRCRDARDTVDTNQRRVANAGCAC